MSTGWTLVIKATAQSDGTASHSGVSGSAGGSLNTSANRPAGELARPAE
jgi:hypothetical protein